MNSHGTNITFANSAQSLGTINYGTTTVQGPLSLNFSNITAVTANTGSKYFRFTRLRLGLAIANSGYYKGYVKIFVQAASVAAPTAQNWNTMSGFIVPPYFSTTYIPLPIAVLDKWFKRTNEIGDTDNFDTLPNYNIYAVCGDTDTASPGLTLNLVCSVAHTNVLPVVPSGGGSGAGAGPGSNPTLESSPSPGAGVGAFSALPDDISSFNFPVVLSNFSSAISESPYYGNFKYTVPLVQSSVFVINPSLFTALVSASRNYRSYSLDSLEFICYTNQWISGYISFSCRLDNNPFVVPFTGTDPDIVSYSKESTLISKSPYPEFILNRKFTFDNAAPFPLFRLRVGLHGASSTHTLLIRYSYRLYTDHPSGGGSGTGGGAGPGSSFLV